MAEQSGLINGAYDVEKIRNGDPKSKEIIGLRIGSDDNVIIRKSINHQNCYDLWINGGFSPIEITEKSTRKLFGDELIEAIKDVSA